MPTSWNWGCERGRTYTEFRSHVSFPQSFVDPDRVSEPPPTPAIVHSISAGSSQEEHLLSSPDPEGSGHAWWDWDIFVTHDPEDC